MIKYTLQCEREHGFESWFPSGVAYDAQRKRGLVLCPECGSKKISKALMAPNLGTRQNKKPDPASARTTAVAVAGPSKVAAQLSERQQAILTMMRELRKEVEANAENVGPNFAEEARKIHHDEAPARGIYGEATVDEAKALHEEGIDVYPLPLLPEDKN
jgi:hypothetical protein